MNDLECWIAAKIKDHRAYEKWALNTAGTLRGKPPHLVALLLYKTALEERRFYRRF